MLDLLLILSRGGSPLRRSALSTGQFLWACLLALSLPWTGPTINAHILEHETEKNQAREALPPHLHEGVHFEAVRETSASPDCVVCLRSSAKGMARAMALTDGSPDAPHVTDCPVDEHIASFRLAGRVAARAPPSFPLDSI